MSCKQIMIVEDDIDIRDALIEMLKMEGYDTYQAGNGRQALDSLKLLAQKQETPGLILLDLMMPVMDGITFLKEIECNYKEFQRIPIVVASASLDFVSNTKLDFAVEKIAKPLDIDLIYQVVRRHCGSPN
jgi:CheY-like chemotaxis protein